VGAAPLAAVRAQEFPPVCTENLFGLVERRIGKVGAMIALIWFGLAVVASPFKSKSRLEAENAVRRHQLIVSQRRVRSRAQATNNDRWFLVQMYRWFPSILTVCVPKT
jgi:hypothetical protein